jgi:hypothetical protein
MKESRKDDMERGKSKGIAPRTPEKPMPGKGSAKQPQGAGKFDVERDPYGKKVK